MTKITNTDDIKAVCLRLLTYLRGYWIAFIIAIVANLLFSAIDASFTYLLKPILDKGFISRDMRFIDILPFLIFGIFILRGIASFLSSYFMATVSRGVVMKFRQNIFRHLMRLPATYYDKTSSGQILSTILFNVEMIASSSADSLTNLVQSGGLIVGLFVVMFTISWQLSLLFVTIVPFIVLAVRYSSRRLRRISHGIQHKMGEVTSIAEEAVEGYQVVRAFGGQNYEIDKFNNATDKNRRRELKVIVTKNLSVIGVQLLAALVLSITIFLATSHGTATMLSAGSFVAFIASMLSLLKPLKNFTAVVGKVQRGLTGAQSVFALLDESAEPDSGTRHIDRVKGDVAFNNVSFAYPNSDKRVLSDVNFSIASGQSVALVGHSGGGKTTVISLLQRLYDGVSGSITIDGIDFKELVLEDLRKQFALVSQQVMLFNDTIAHNIAYGRFDQVSEAEIIEAAKAANAWDFIEQMPQGIHTLIGENGVLLSGGQRQRLAIARAILKDAPILILDEATSALDTESERQIQMALNTLMRNRTTFVIAHRLSTIEHADKILVVQEGRIVESGKHAELLSGNGYYSKLYNMQFQD